MASKKPLPRPNDAAVPEPESFEATARRLLDQALSLYAAERSLATREIRDGVKSLVAHAQARGVRVEQVIIDLKHACHRSESTAQHKPEVVSTLVTMCIHEFYDAEPEQLDG